MPELSTAFAQQPDVRQPWRAFLDALIPLRPQLHRYCCRLTGDIWDGEDLVQEALAKVFSMLGKIDAQVQNPRAYLLRTATNLWIDEQRRRQRERALHVEPAAESAADPAIGAEGAAAARLLLQSLPPRERAALVLRDVLDFSAEEAAQLLGIAVGAVKAALHRARAGSLDIDARARTRTAPSAALVQQFMEALAANDLQRLEAICATDLQVELVGGAELVGFEAAKTFFAHANLVLPAAYAELRRKMVLGDAPHWRCAAFEGEPLLLGFRTFDAVVGLNEVHRIEESDGRIVRIRCYCFAPDSLRALGHALGVPALPKPYRSPDPPG